MPLLHEANESLLPYLQTASTLLSYSKKPPPLTVDLRLRERVRRRSIALRPARRS